MSNITTTSLLPASVQQSLALDLLSVPVPNMIFNVCAMKQRMPRNGGTTLRMSRYNPLIPSLIPLGNSGAPVSGQNLTKVDIDAKISFYGTYIAINEQVTLQSQDPVLSQAAQRLGVCLRQTEDELMRNLLAATATRINCSGGNNGQQPTEITYGDIQAVTASLLGSNAMTISSMIEGADKFGKFCAELKFSLIDLEAVA